jgi:hypothetical protein
MALSASTLQSALQPGIKNAIVSQFGAAGDESKLDKFASALAQAIAEAVVAHVKMADVVPGSFTTSQGPVSGVGKIT